MRFEATTIPGVVVVDLERNTDERGFFARTHCPEEFALAGYPFVPQQTSLSHNHTALTLRGLHYQSPPNGETKLVRAVRGRIYDVALDLRPQSPTYMQWTAVELSATNGRALLIPVGVAHGFLTLEPNSDVLYQIDRIYTAGFGSGVRWNDPAFAIEWPAEPNLISSRDAGIPDFAAEGLDDARG